MRDTPNLLTPMPERIDSERQMIKTEHRIEGLGVVVCHAHDCSWVEEKLNMLPAPMRASVAAKYSKVYQDTLESLVGAIAPENAARRDANTRLRECVDVYGEAYHGRTVSPGS